MNYYKARMYSPTLGRFLQTDLLGYAYGMNWYAYVGGDPVNFSDPSGLCYYENWATFLYWTPRGGERHRLGMVPGSEYVKAVGCDTTTQYVGNAVTQGGPSENSGGDSSDFTITVTASRPGSLSGDLLRTTCGFSVCSEISNWGPNVLAPSMRFVGWVYGKVNRPCVRAVGGAMISSVFDPASLVGSAAAGAVGSRAAFARSAYAMSTAVRLTRAAAPGFAIATGVTATYNGVYAYNNDARCG
jgi:hypothetical protein